MSKRYRFVIDRSLPGGVRITTALEYGDVILKLTGSPFGIRHWCALEPRTQVPAPMTACGLVDAQLAFTTGVNGPEDVTCPHCKIKLDDWLAKIAANKIGSDE